MAIDSGLREKITKAIERAMLEDTGRGVGVQCVAAGYILAIPEIKEALHELALRRRVEKHLARIADERPFIDG